MILFYGVPPVFTPSGVYRLRDARKHAHTHEIVLRIRLLYLAHYTGL